ncbi:MAG: DUF1993 domain-containing protein, partial [Caulobacterales bacterium]|nr:DUF1993 domain-containing protein [Caulobacterales bacterium]
ASAKTYLQGLTPETVDALEEGEVVFSVGDRVMPFRTPDFLLSFSVPNFHFHATTAYDILRVNGAPLGKRYYLGHLPVKRA